jgi:rhomboid protease GluP
MSAFDSTAESALDAPPVNLVEAGVYQTYAEGSEHGLVVLAIGRPYWLVPAADGFQLLVEPDTVAWAREQLARFDRESVHWPPRPYIPQPALRKADLLTPLIWAWSVVVLFLAQGRWPDLVDRGLLDANAVVARGEVWRAFTALFLHADVPHVVSNVLGGFLVFTAVISTLGRMRGWLSLAVAAIAGNLAAVALHYPAPYHSLGASTAVFAGVGLLTGAALRPRTFFVPLLAGCTVLALYGAGVGGERIDVGAHATGFVAGLLTGLIVRQKPPQRA